MTQRYEYKVVPAPEKGQKAKGVKGTPARFAFGLTRKLNELAREGWDYLRAETLPCEERTGLTGKTITYQNMLVFRRAVPGALPILDEATVTDGLSVAGALRSASALPPALVPGAHGGDRPDGADNSAADDSDDDFGDEQDAETDEGPADRPAARAAGKPPLTAAAPGGKAPRITAFERLADASGKDSPAPGKAKTDG